MNPQAQTTQTTKNGTSKTPPTNSQTPAIDSTQAPKKKPGPKPKVATTIPKGVLNDVTQLDASITMAKNSQLTRILVTPDVLKSILKDKYKDDPYMIYYNIELHDFNKVDQTERQAAETMEEKIFGKSQAKIGPIAMTTTAPPSGAKK